MAQDGHLPHPLGCRWAEIQRLVTAKELAESYRAKLRAAARRGEGFDAETGLPESMVRTLRDVSFYEHCAEFAAATWAVSAAKTRVSVIETLTRVVPVVVTDLRGAPEAAVLRSALRKQLNQGEHGRELDDDETRAINWLARASRPVGSLADPAVVCDVLDALTVNLNGKPAAPEYFSRRRRVMHRAPGLRGAQETSVRRVLSSGAGEFLVPMGMSCEVGFLLRLVFGVPRFRSGPPRGPGCGHAEVPRRDD